MTVQATMVMVEQVFDYFVATMGATELTSCAMQRLVIFDGVSHQSDAVPIERLDFVAPVAIES